MTITSNFVSLSNTNFWAKLCRYLLGSETRLFSSDTRHSHSQLHFSRKVRTLHNPSHHTCNKYQIPDDDCVISVHCVLEASQAGEGGRRQPLWRVELRSSAVWSISQQRDWCVSYMIAWLYQYLVRVNYSPNNHLATLHSFPQHYSVTATIIPRHNLVIQ